MKITVINPDKAIYIDGVSIDKLDLSFLPSDIHAIQWYGNKGHIEFCDPDTGLITRNEDITVLPYADQLLSAWQTEKDARSAMLMEQNLSPAPTKAITSTTPLQYVERFTDAEQLAIVTATMNNPVIKLWYDKLMAASEVVFSDPRLSAGMDVMVAAGLITQARSEEILPLDVRSTGMTTA